MNWMVHRSTSNAAIKIVLGVLLCLSLTSTQAQDIHFSQYFLTDISTTPAAAGDFDGDYRVSGVHRNQWRSVTTPYSTFQFAGDIKDVFNARNLGLGLRIFNDRAGDSRLNTFSAAVSLAGITSMNPDSSLRLHTGFEIGYTQQNLDYAALQFDQQYNGFIYDASLFNGEDDQGNTAGRVDFHAGLYVTKTIDRHQSYTIGISAWNLSTPNVNFKTDQAVKLDQRIAFYADYEHRFARDWDILPGGRAMFQGPYQELLIGARVRHTWEHNAMVKRRMYLGGYSRIRDGAYIVFGVEHDAWTVGLSYDVNLSPLEVASRNRGAFEIALIRTFDVFKEIRVPHRQCIDLL